MTWWRWLPLWVAIITGVVGVAIGAAITSGFNYLSNQNDRDAKMIELSVEILRAEVTPETIPLRQWAIDVMNKRANFQFNAERQAALLKERLPDPHGWAEYPIEKRPGR